MKNIKYKVFFIILILGAVLSGCGTGKALRSDEFMTDKMTPQIEGNGADPWILQQDGIYYYTKTTGNNVTISRSAYLTDVAAGESRVIYEADHKLENFWAPELHRLEDTWYVYFAANPFDSDIHRMYVLVNENEDPFEGEWQCMEMEGMDDKFAIDGTVLTLESGSYFIWSGWEGYENVQQNLYLAEMVSPTQVKEEKILLSQPEYDWELNGTPLINEGPQVLVRDNTVNLVYSASGSWTDDYCLGLLSASADASIKDPSAWTKETMPLFSRTDEIYGPGHNGFAKSPDGSEDFIIYHAARWGGSGWNRSIRIQKISFDEKGKIQMEAPLSTDALMKLPAGEPQRIRFTGKDFSYTDGIHLDESDSSFEGAVVGFEDVSDALTVSFHVPEEGTYTIIVYAKINNCYLENYQSGLEISVNGTVERKELYPSEYYQPLFLRQTLKKGETTIEIRSEAGGDELSIERIELMPAFLAD